MVKIVSIPEYLYLDAEEFDGRQEMVRVDYDSDDVEYTPIEELED